MEGSSISQFSFKTHVFFSQVLTDSCMESMATGVEGILTDLYLISMNWPLAISDINQNPNKIHPFYMFHGDQGTILLDDYSDSPLDSIVSVGCARYYERIPHINYSYCKECGHGLLGNETAWAQAVQSVLNHV